MLHIHYVVHVATALTVNGIETHHMGTLLLRSLTLQQHLPLTVLKPETIAFGLWSEYSSFVATALTVNGIETQIRKTF